MKQLGMVFLWVLCANVLADEEDGRLTRDAIETRLTSDVIVKQNTQEQATDAPADVNTDRGAVVYGNACGTCHAENTPLKGIGAPLVNDKKDWQERADKGLKALVGSVENGLNAMPAGGNCRDCSREDFEKAIRYMLPEGVKLGEDD